MRRRAQHPTLEVEVRAPVSAPMAQAKAAKSDRLQNMYRCREERLPALSASAATYRLCLKLATACWVAACSEPPLPQPARHQRRSHENLRHTVQHDWSWKQLTVPDPHCLPSLETQTNP